MAKPALLVYTNVYGDSADYWRHTLGSLKWPKNAEIIKAARFRIWTDQPELAAELLEGFDCEIGSAPGKEAFLATLEEACETKVPLLMAPPDLIWGDGSVANLLNVCLLSPCRGVAAGHIRVLPEIMEELTRPLGNAELVSAAFRHLHPVFGNSEANELNNAYHVGTSWRTLEAGLYAATFHIPTVHVIQVIREDIDYFAKNDFGMWDHDWPTLLIRKGRHKLMGSSDGAFLCEITSEKTHNKPIQDPAKRKHEGFDVYKHGEKLHCLYNANTEIILRGA